MASIPNHKSDVVFSGKIDALSYITTVCCVDSIDWLIAQGAILDRTLAGSDVQYRT